MIKVPAALLGTDYNGYTESALARKEQFHRQGKSFLKKIAAAIGLPAGSFDIRSNKAGMACSGEVTLHGEHIYIQLSESCMGPGLQALFRTCNGRKDYTGGANNFAKLESMSNDDCAGFIRRVRLMIQ